ncbi:DMT family transporter [Ideonella sp. BN130291]|uniref:DMT family transporter n=1 Tax=Ideonella sp. BN130291 TaxID=3112940 RepID=UPI002E25C0F9|nr:multidrug efflux SMR transporter [Ideonella sp. BN130291]
MAWLLLVAAGVFEVAWALGLKTTDGFTRPLPTVLTLAAMGASVGLLGLAVKQLPISTAYAVWTGIGAVGTALLGVWWLGEAMTPLKAASLALITLGLVGLKLG